MKAIVAVLGVLAGLFTGIVLVLVNPLGYFGGIRSIDDDAVNLDFTGSVYRGMELNNGAIIGFSAPGSRVGIEDAALGLGGHADAVVPHSETGRVVAHKGGYLHLAAIGHGVHRVEDEID